MLSYAAFVCTMQHTHVTMSLHTRDGNELIQHNTNTMQKKRTTQRNTTQHNTTQHNTTQQNKTKQNTAYHKKLTSHVTTFWEDHMTNECFRLKSNVM